MHLNVNGLTREVEADPNTPLLYVLRNNLQLNGPKYGCGMEHCGSCMVLIDNIATPSCRIPVRAVQKNSITTLEGLVSATGELHPVQQAFIDEQAAQCGYCLNGMVITAVALLRQNKQPDRADIQLAMQRNMCRCGAHTRIVRAIQSAATKL